MKIKTLNKSTKSIVEFAKREWENADIEHYGVQERFTSKKFVIVAYKNRRIVGKVTLKVYPITI